MSGNANIVKIEGYALLPELVELPSFSNGLMADLDGHGSVVTALSLRVDRVGRTALPSEAQDVLRQVEAAGVMVSDSETPTAPCAPVTVLLCEDAAGIRSLVFTTPKAAFTTWARIPGVRAFYEEFDPKLLARVEAGEATQAECEEALRMFNDAGEDSYIIETTQPEEHPYADGHLV